jgi:uncharacterized Ntn-hydrolase superfamily protein
MTWSIIARDKATGSFGIAVATKFFAAGARVPFIAAGVGAIATQALINPFYGTKGLQLLRSGMTADSIIRPLVANDAGRDHRQVHVMDASGRIAAHTGAACIDWNGHLAGDTFSIAGNMLADAQVLDATAAAYIAGEPTPFPRRLIAAMRAGDAAGGTNAANNPPRYSSMAKTSGRTSTCAWMIIRNHSPNSSDLRASAASAGLFSGVSCQVDAIPWE